MEGQSGHKETKRYVERHLFVRDSKFLIRPNGGTGDCMFKAVCQAVEGNEEAHGKIRKEIVNFIVENGWNKFKESIEIQHVQGNKMLQEKWTLEPIETYKDYMNTSGNLGSSSELTAAGELFNYNFSTIQEYVDEDDKKSYRVENCCPFNDQSVPFHYFYFTGDYDNGHWEYLKEFQQQDPIPDGLYSGCVKIFIEDIETSFEDWLKVHTDNTNDELGMKRYSKRTLAKRSSHPFEWDTFNYENRDDSSVILKDLLYHISKFRCTDLFTTLLATLFPEVDVNDGAIVDRLEEQIINYRLANIHLLNYKLITQPYSHNFEVDILKYIAAPLKGNIQDLLSAADLFGFSFQIFLKPEKLEPVKSCTFIHVDRWGGETDKMLHFFMRLSSGKRSQDEIVAKWWRLTPNKEIGHSETRVQQIGDFSAKDNNEIDENSNRQQRSNASDDDAYETVTDEDENGNDEDEGLSSPELNVQKLMNIPKKEKYKTVVEIYDEETKKRKQYVFEGFKTRDQVLQTLKEKGYIKNVPPSSIEKKKKISPIDIKHNESTTNVASYKSSRPPTISKASSTTTSKLQASSIIDTFSCSASTAKSDEGIINNNSPIQTSYTSVKFEDIGTCQEITNLEERRLSSKPPSVIALVDKESAVDRNSKFSKLHQRVAPWASKECEEENTISVEKKKSLFRRFVCWVAFLFRNCNNQQISKDSL